MYDINLIISRSIALTEVTISQMGNAPASTIGNVQPVTACNTRQTTTWSGNVKTGQIERRNENIKEDCSKPDCKTSGCYDGRHDKK
ncbi:unnamed protein product [Rotaria sordida]|uniref:Uncharacterized protein n=1 Tax=Rotaria sordida TaxID=392033 RepID=A0A815A1J1_9BILA|nr:unnamed protein product [Rotaria sordida]